MKSIKGRSKLLRLSVVVVLLFVASVESAYSFEEDGIYYNIVSSTDLTCEVTYYSSNASLNRDYYVGGIAIPDIVSHNNNEYTVVGIGRSAFNYCSKMEWVTIPQTVTYIGNSAFYRCYGLSEIIIPKDVTSIGNSAFYDCYGLSEISIPSKVESIDNYAFYNCNQITEITIPSSVTTIGTYAFQNCPLTMVVLEDNSEPLDMSASRQSYTPFYDCPIETLYLGRQISYTGSYSPFRDITSLTSLTITDNVTSIGQYMFYGCTGLMGELTIPNSVTSIGEYAFQGCKGLTDVTIPESVTSIGSYAFYNCNLNELYFYGSLDSYYLVFQGLTCNTLYAHKDEVDAIREYYSGTVVPLEDVYNLSVEGVYPRSISLRVDVNEKLMVDGVSLKGVQVNGTEITARTDGLYVAKDLLPNTSYTCSVTFMYRSEEIVNEIEATTINFYEKATIENITASSVSVAITLIGDAYSDPPDEYGLLYDGKYYAADENGVAKVTGLQRTTQYTSEVYAKYGNDVVKGESITITTQTVIEPTVTTLSATDITFQSAVLNATITAGEEEILEQGFEYFNNDMQRHNVEGSGEDMSVTITDLESFSYYYYRAYAKTESGVNYGEYSYFITKFYYATEVTTKPADKITSSTARLSGSVSGSDEILEKGFEYWTTEDDVQIVVAEDNFYTTLTGLTPTTNYYFRAYVKTERVHDYGETLTFTTESEMYDLYLELYDEINAVVDYFLDFYFGHPNVSKYIEDIAYIDLRLSSLLDKLKKAYEDGTLDDDLAEEIRSELEDLRNRIDYLSATLLYEELSSEINSTETLLKDTWNTISTDYADVADDFKDEYDALMEELNKLLEELENAYNNGTLTDELAEEIREKLEKIKEKIENLLATAKEAHGTAGIDSIFSKLGDDIQIHNLSGIRVDTPTKGRVYIIHYSDGTVKKVFLK